MPSTPLRRILRWIKRLALGLLALVVLFILIVFATDRIREARSLAHPPEASLAVDVGGRKVHLYLMGKENPGPAIVLIPGQPGDASPDSGWWAAVQPALAESHRVYAYDEPGYGWSEPHPDGFTCQRSAEDLHTALNSLAEREVILVAFANGNMTALDLSAAQADGPRVLGMLWIDPDELTPQRTALMQQDTESLQGLIRAAGVLTELGLGRLALYGAIIAPADQGELGLLPVAQQAGFNWDYYEQIAATRGNRSALHATLDRAANYVVDMQYAAGLPLPGNIPVDIVQTGLTGEFDKVSEAGRAQIGLKTGWYKQVVSGSAGGRYLSFPDSSHLIIIEQPDAVIQAVLDLYKRVTK